jgi:PTS system N-acetylgalactosamine-specific IIC component
MAGLGAAGGAMRFVGFAILMKVMMAPDMWGFLLAGFSAALVFQNLAATAGATLMLVAFIGVALALYDYNVNSKIKANAGSNMGGASDGI